MFSPTRSDVLSCASTRMGGEDSPAATPYKADAFRSRQAADSVVTTETETEVVSTGEAPATASSRASRIPNEAEAAALDPAEELMLQRLFERYCSHGKNRQLTPEKQLCMRGFGPARRGHTSSAVAILQEDIRKFPARLRHVPDSREPPFVFSRFASGHRESAQRMDGPQFAKLCRECKLLDYRVLDEYLMATGLTAAEADIAFRKVLCKTGRRSLDYDQFCTALLPDIARKKAIPVEKLMRQVLGDNPLERPFSSPSSSVVGDHS